MSMLGLTRQERGIVAFLTAGLVLGSLVTLYKRHLKPPVLPEVDPKTVAAFDSISQRLAEEDRRLALQAPATTELREEKPQKQLQSQAAGELQRIDVNSADEEELVRLPGIGKVMARRIVVYRQQHGRFDRIEDLRKVRGIGPKVLEKISPFVTLSGP
jgi:competence protein ComEA